MDREIKNVLDARKLLDQLKELDSLVHRAYFEMGRILNALKTHELWKPLGYKSFKEMIEEELTLSYGTACCYASVYANSKVLGYTDLETIRNIEVIGLRALARLLPSMKQKLGIRALQNRKEEMERVVSFWLTPDELYELENKLLAHGLVVKNGRWINSTEALLSALLEQQRKAA